MTQATLTLVMMAIVGVTFLVLHLLLRSVPYDETSPRERWPWPVWSWYPLALGFGLLAALAANLYWIQRTPDHGNVAEDPGWESDIQPVRGQETPTPAATPTGQSRVVPKTSRILAQADVPVSGDAAAATPVGTPASAQPIGEGGPAWAEPGGTPIPDPFASPVATTTATPTASPSPSPSPSASPSPSPR